MDIERWNYADAREVPFGTMTPEEIDIWTKAIETRVDDQKLSLNGQLHDRGSPTAVV